MEAEIIYSDKRCEGIRAQNSHYHYHCSWGVIHPALHGNGAIICPNCNGTGKEPEREYPIDPYLTPKQQ